MATGYSGNFPFPLDSSPLLRRREVLELLKISTSCLYSGMARGVYPRPIRIGSRAVAWRREDIERIMQNGVEKPGSNVNEE